MHTLFSPSVLKSELVVFPQTFIRYIEEHELGFRRLCILFVCTVIIWSHPQTAAPHSLSQGQEDLLQSHVNAVVGDVAVVGDKGL